MHSRRNFLRVVGAGAAVTLVPACAGNPQQQGGAQQAHGSIPAGNVSELQAATPKVLSNQPVMVMLDEQGVYAMSTICPHASCDMRDQGTLTATEAFCACHGSTFDKDGNVTHGPANRPLPHYAVDIDSAGEMTVQADQVVDASTRTPVG